MEPIPALIIDPPLLNSSNPWATSLEDLRDLYASPYTGAVTTRTSLLTEFPHDPGVHQYTFFSTALGASTTAIPGTGRGPAVADETSSVNTLGYSPIPLRSYLSYLASAASGEYGLSFSPRPSKPFIVSVTGAADEIADCYTLISATQAKHPASLSLAMEINLSCPNIPSKPPPAYSGPELLSYLRAVYTAIATSPSPRLHVGIKTPPYTTSAQFDTLISALRTSSHDTGCPVTFITASNTLAYSLVLTAATSDPALASANGTGLGGMAGAALHPLALGNVRTIRSLLDASEEEDVRRIRIIGVGGVSDAAGAGRMRSVGASAVGVGTALGRDGVGVFARIAGQVD